MKEGHASGVGCDKFRCGFGWRSLRAGGYDMPTRDTSVRQPERKRLLRNLPKHASDIIQCIGCSQRSIQTALRAPGGHGRRYDLEMLSNVQRRQRTECRARENTTRPCCNKPSIPITSFEMKERRRWLNRDQKRLHWIHGDGRRSRLLRNPEADSIIERSQLELSREAFTARHFQDCASMEAMGGGWG
jgi:hypothetical protein